MSDPDALSWWSTTPMDEGNALPENEEGGDAPQIQQPTEARPFEMDDGSLGLALDDAFDSYKELRDLDAEIAKIESELRKHGGRLFENMEGDDGDEVMRKARNRGEGGKKFMTLSDIKPTSMFDFMQPPPPPPDDAYVDTGRRLKDGAPFLAVRSPSLGITTPIYIRDVVGPTLFLAFLVAVLFLYLLHRQSRLTARLRAAEASAENERQRMARLTDAMALQNYNPLG